MAFRPALRPGVADGLELAGCNAGRRLGDLCASLATSRLPHGRLHCASARSSHMDRPSSPAWCEVDRSTASVISRPGCGSSCTPMQATPCANTSCCRHPWKEQYDHCALRCTLKAAGTTWFSETRASRVSHQLFPSACPISESAYPNAVSNLRMPRGEASSFHFACVRPRCLLCHPGSKMPCIDQAQFEEPACLNRCPAPRRLRNPREHGWPLARSPPPSRRSFPSKGQADRCDPQISSGARSAGWEARRQVAGT